MLQSNQGRDAGEAIGQFAEGVVANVLGKVGREIEGQIAAMNAERGALAERLRSTTDRAGRLSIQSRIDRLDREIRELETVRREVRFEGRPSGTKMSGQLQPSVGQPFIPPDNFNPAPMVIGIVGILFVAFPLTLAVVRFLWKRATPAPGPAITAEQQQRFDRLEQSVDAIAIEIERISENQRYLTKMLAEPKKEGLGAGR